MEENRIFDLVLVKYGHVLVNFGQFFLNVVFFRNFCIDVREGLTGSVDWWESIPRAVLIHLRFWSCPQGDACKEQGEEANDTKR
jgi:hypothetical protein